MDRKKCLKGTITGVTLVFVLFILILIVLMQNCPYHANERNGL